MLPKIDEWAASKKLSRSEALRALIELALAGMQPTGRQSPKGASKARDLASEQIDKLIDPSATDQERQQRKRRLLKGPQEFRKIRGDNLAKAKR